VNSQWPTQALSLEYDSILWDKKSAYQHVQVFHNKVWGNVLVLDGVIQVTEKDEIAYHELIVHIPMFSHKNPERVLVVGGGDGGSIREALKHPSVKEVTICEIDQMVIDVSKQFLPNLAASYADPRVKVLCRDAAKYMEEKDVLGTYDIIVADTSDPVGPAAALFEAPFYKCMFNALRPGGKVATQAESIWLNLDLIQRLVTANLGTFANVEYATTQIPTYPCGQIGFLLCSKAEDVKSKSKKNPLARNLYASLMLNFPKNFVIILLNFTKLLLYCHDLSRKLSRNLKPSLLRNQLNRLSHRRKETKLTASRLQVKVERKQRRKEARKARNVKHGVNCF